MHITIDVTIYEEYKYSNRSETQMKITAPIDMALNANWGEIVQMLIQQAHDSYLEDVAGEGIEQ